MRTLLLGCASVSLLDSTDAAGDGDFCPGAIIDAAIIDPAIFADAIFADAIIAANDGAALAPEQHFGDAAAAAARASA